MTKKKVKKKENGTKNKKTEQKTDTEQIFIMHLPSSRPKKNLPSYFHIFLNMGKTKNTNINLNRKNKKKRVMEQYEGNGE